MAATTAPSGSCNGNGCNSHSRYVKMAIAIDTRWRWRTSLGAGPSKGSVSQIEDSTVSAAAGTQGKMGKGAARKDKGKRPQKGPMKCFVCGAPHRFFECPKWKSLLALADKKPAQGN